MHEKKIIDRIKDDTEVKTKLEIISKINTLEYILIENKITNIDKIKELNEYFLEENTKHLIELIPERLKFKNQKNKE